MPDVVTLITSQHREIEELLEQAQQEDTDTLALLRRVAGLLGPHSEAEESFVYPRIAALRPAEAEEVHDGAAEHHHAEALLSELLAGKPDDPGYDGKLAALAGELKHHVEEEESELLPVLSDRASDEERDQLGARFAARTGHSEVRPDAMAGSNGSRSSGGSTGSGGSRGSRGSRSSRSSGGSRGSRGSGKVSTDASKAELYEKARKAGIPGRSKMTKDELATAINKLG